MWPELCARKLVISPVTQTWPTWSSSNRRICHVNSETLSTLRWAWRAYGGNSSPKSHCDFTGFAMGAQLQSTPQDGLRHKLTKILPRTEIPTCRDFGRGEGRCEGSRCVICSTARFVAMGEAWDAVKRVPAALVGTRSVSG